MLWSDKVGYIFISVDLIRRTVADSDSWVVECAEDLLINCCMKWRLTSWSRMGTHLILKRHQKWSVLKLNADSNPL